MEPVEEHSYNCRIHVEHGVTQLSMFRAISNLTKNEAQ